MSDEAERWIEIQVNLERENAALREQIVKLERDYRDRTELAEAQRRRAESAEQQIVKLTEALEPFARLGMIRKETLDRLSNLNKAFWDVPADTVLYNDHMGHVITVRDVRKAAEICDARAALQAEKK